MKREVLEAPTELLPHLLPYLTSMWTGCDGCAQVPKVDAKTMAPAVWPQNPQVLSTLSPFPSIPPSECMVVWHADGVVPPWPR